MNVDKSYKLPMKPHQKNDNENLDFSAVTPLNFPRQTEVTNKGGVLYIVATPLGNLQDISFRAISTLKNCDLVLAEDTRTFKILAAHFKITTPVQSYHDHNERQRTSALGIQLVAGKNLALVSEAGTPTISDPGYHLVKECHKLGIPVRPIPGPCAAIAALSVSGFETHRFCFEGFLPVKKGKLRRVLQKALEAAVTTICYESPYRIVKTLQVIEELAPSRLIFVARELTKVYEECYQGTALEIKEIFEKGKKQKGELVLILSGS